MGLTLLNLFLLCALLFVLYRSLRTAFLHLRAAAEPTCAACGYIVLGLTTTTCPECGSDFLITGVLPPGRIGLRFGRAIVWSLLILLAANISSMLCGKIHHYSRDAHFDLTIPGTSSGPLVILYLDAEGYSPRLSPDHVEVYAFGPSPVPGTTTAFGVTHGTSSWGTLVPAGPRATLFRTPGTGDWKLTDPSRSIQTKTLTDAQVDAWLSAIGIASDLARAHELAQTIGEAQDTSDLEHFAPGASVPLTKWRCFSFGGGSGSSPDPTLQFANAWLFAFLWAYSLRRTIAGRPEPLRGHNAARLLLRAATPSPPPQQSTHVP